MVLKIITDPTNYRSKSFYDVLSARPLGVKPRSEALTPQPAFMQLVRQELQTKLGDQVKKIYRGLKFLQRLILFHKMQRKKAVETGVADLRKTRKINDPRRRDGRCRSPQW